jgi:hypothetical protein
VTIRETVGLDGWRYHLDVRREAASGPDVPRLLIPAYQPNETASGILKACIRSIQKHTPRGSYELWVVDSHSPRACCEWLLDWPGINVALNHTEPRPPEERPLPRRMQFWRNQTRWGSYANAVGLELALRLIPTDTTHIMTLHMDTMACHPGWLAYLRSKLGPVTPAAGVCAEHLRCPEGVLHVLGMLIDYQVYRAQEMDLMPALPAMDVGDQVTHAIRRAGMNVFVCANTYEQPDLVARIATGSPWRNLDVVRVFDDSGNVIFAHLGRGIPKAGAVYQGKTASAQDWIALDP